MRVDALEKGLSALSARQAADAEAARATIIHSAELIERLTEKTAQRFSDLRSEWDLRAASQRAEIRGEVTTLKSATEAVVDQLDQGSRLLERELGVTRDALAQVVMLTLLRSLLHVLVDSIWTHELHVAMHSMWICVVEMNMDIHAIVRIRFMMCLFVLAHISRAHVRDCT